MSIRNDQLMQEVIAEKLQGSAVKAADNSVNPAMLDSLDRMNKTSVNRSYRAIPASGIRSRIIRLCKRLMRRLTFWYVEPCMMQQTEYNNANNIFSAEVNSEINMLRMQTQEQETSVQALRNQLTALQNQLGQVVQEKKSQHRHYEQQLLNMQQQYTALEEAVPEMIDEKLSTLQEQVRTLERVSFLNGGDRLHQNEVNDFRVSFSQSGEDAVIRYVFSVLGVNPAECRYLDLGANHAVYLSNTYGFYRDGARGVLVEANPVLAQELAERRPGDTVINRCLSEIPDTQVQFYIMSGDGLSTMDLSAAQGFVRKNPTLCIEKTITVGSVTIDEIISEYFPEKAPEILNIDIEGMELKVLRMIDFTQFRPLIIICEMIEYRKELTIGEKNQEILEFMRSVGYEEFAFSGINSIFIDKTIQERSE